jgi:hypothetical protein
LSFVTPRTWSAAELVTAAKMNEIRDALRSSGGATTTSVPGSPTDEDELNYPADTTNGAMWRFKYRSASGSAFKWEFIGGAAMYAAIATDETTTSTSFVDLATVGPSITVPRAGDYEVEVGATMWDATGASACYASVKRGAAATTNNDAVSQNGVVAAPGVSVSRKIIMTGLAASDVLKVQYTVSAGTGHFIFRWLAVRPVRVS